MCAHRDMLSMSNFWRAGVQKVELSTKKLLLGCCGPVRHFTLILIKLNMCTWTRVVSWLPVHRMY